MEKHQFKLLLACLVISIVSVIFIFRSKVGMWAPAATPESRSYTPPIAKADIPNETNMTSPDGKLSLNMKEEKGKDGATYVVKISNTVDGSQKEVYRRTEPVGTILAVPLNTFSPDNKYLFLKERSADGQNYIVLTSSGAPISKDAQTLEITSSFSEKHPEYKITDVTGWGGITLIVVNTDKASGGQGPSFWFDVASHSFIQLSNRFN